MLGSSGGSAGGIAGLLAMLQKQGVGAKEMNSFMPQIASFVKSQCGVDISSVLGIAGGGGDSGSAGAGGAADAQAAVSNALGGLFGNLE